MRTRRLLTTTRGLIMLLALLTTAFTTMPAAAGPPSAPRSDRMLASYGGEIREADPRADGYRHVDTPATLRALSHLHNDTFIYLIWDAPSDWDDLRTEFLPAAQRQGLDVWVYLVPPTECSPSRCSHPFTTDYLTWAKEIATLSTRYPALKGYAIDDFNHNLGLFTPDYVQRMQQTSKSVNPSLRFMPQVYNGTITRQFTDAYAPVIDGLIMAYRDDPYRNTQRTDSLRAQLDAASAQLAPHGKQLYLMNYTSALSGTPMPPTPQYVRETTQVGAEYTAAGKLGGTITYILPLDPADDWRNDNHAHTGNGRLSLFLPAGVPTQSGGYAEAAQTVTVDPDGPHRIRFQQDDTYYNGGVPTGYHLKQLLVDGQVVWQQDAALDEAGSYKTVEVDLDPYVEGKTSATIAFRLYEAKGVTNFWVDTLIDDVEPTGLGVANGGFETRTGWTLSANSRALLPDFDIYDPQRAVRSYHEVQQVYGVYRLLFQARSASVSDDARRSLMAMADLVVRDYGGGRLAPAARRAAALGHAAKAQGLADLARLAAEVSQQLAP
ncbi:hypothetical protein ABZV31_35675 [Streptomyces sp. NPDC005202]|uniref:hypothetical protein n=1 Tax=Streptomyces sp. NPDC005202 TaxID=3157021 RepID=UPI0033AC6721